LISLPPAFKHRRFTLFWIGLTLAQAGAQMQLWGLLWHIRTLSDQPFALGVVGLIRFTPTLIFSLVAGLAADLANRRLIMLATQAILALTTAMLAFLTLESSVDLMTIYLVIGVQAVIATFELPARQSLFPNLVPARDLQNAFSLQILSYQIGALVGPALSGLAIARLGLSGPYILSTAAVTIMLALLLLVGPVSQKRTLDRGRRANGSAIREGLQFTFRHPLILSSMLLDFFVTALTRADTLMPIFARDILFVGPVAYGWLSAAQSMGASLTSVILSQIQTLRRQGLALLGAVTVVGLGTIVFGASRVFALSMAALALVGASDAVSSVIRNTLRQLQTPDQLRGRMVGVNQIFFSGGPQLGEVRAGALGQLIGVPLAVASGGVACLAAVGWIAYRWPQLRKYEGIGADGGP
jgi:MFS family permease